MATVILPLTFEFASYEFHTELEGVLYYFKIKYNNRMSRWTMNILDENEEMIISGVVLITGYNLLAIYQDPRLPPGDFFMYDETGAKQTSTREELGNTVKLFYIESEG